MESREAEPNTEVVEGKPVKIIAQEVVSLENKMPVKSAIEQLETHGLEEAPVTDPEGRLLGKISKDRIIGGVSGRGHDPETTALEPEVEKEAEPYCHENEPIAKAERIMRRAHTDAVSVVSEDKKLIGRATLHAIEEKKLKAESAKPRTALKAAIVFSTIIFGVAYFCCLFRASQRI
jgi:CBS domain-containing protein